MNTAQKIAKESTISFIGIFYGSINRYLYSALLARWVGPEYLGIYSMANAIMLIGEVLSKMGMETGTMRFISRLDPKKDQKEISRIIASAMKMCFVVSLVVAAALIASSSFIVYNILSEKPLMINVLIVFAMALPFNAMTLIGASATQGYKKLKYKAFVTQFVNPTILLFSMIICFLQFSAESALMYPILITGILGFYVMLRPIKSLSSMRAVDILKGKKNYELLKYSYPFMFVIILQTFMHWMDILMLGYFTSAETVGLYHPAARTAGLLQSLLMSFISIYAPMISQFHSEQNVNKMNEAYKLVSRWLLVFSIPISVVFVLFPGNILALFGQEYTASSSILIILTVATLIQAIFGAASPTLGMTGFPKIVLINTAIAFSMNFILNIFLIPKFGVEGAAFATLSTLSIVGCVRALQVRMILKMNFLSFKMIKPVISGILTYVLLMKIKPLMLDFSFIVELIIALLICGLVYLVLLWLMGIDEEDKNFITGLGIIKKGFGKKK